MSFLNNLLKAFVGDKTKKDLKSILPLVDAIKSHKAALEQLSHDELRAKTLDFKAKIKEGRAPFDTEIEAHKKPFSHSKILMNASDCIIVSINSKRMH